VDNFFIEIRPINVHITVLQSQNSLFSKKMLSWRRKLRIIMNIQEIQDQIIKEFEQYDNWEDKYSHLIKLGKELEPFPDEFRTEKFKLSGCQSQVWMNAKLDNEKMVIQGDSDAMIVKGLVSLLVKVYSGHHPKEILNTPPQFLTKIGIDKHLSPTRKNGLGAMLKQIQMFAVAFNTVVGTKK